jgi:replicative DNA helicase|tara:strand:+ start:1008 stop:2237 length:1230 start_codon:yes stop_codon:yes gene_type:complete
MELSLIRSLMDKDFYDDHKGSRCPDRLFTKDVRKIKQAIDNAMVAYERSVTPAEIEALFMANNPTLTTAQKQAYSVLFMQVNKETPMGSDIAQEVLSKLFQQVIGEDIANLGFDYVNGSKTSLDPLRQMLEQYQDDFTPNLKVTWEDIDFDTIMSLNDLETRWTFNIPSLTRKVEGINAGHLIEVGARPNTGKTSFHASLVAGPNGFCAQGARVIVLCNEEGYGRVVMRYINAVSGYDKHELQKPDIKKKAMESFLKIKPNLMFKDATGRDMNWVESVCKSYKPDIIILDMGDKFARTAGFSRPDEALKANAIQARQIAKQQECAVFYMSQLSADAEGKVVLNQAMMEGSRTGKAAEADLMIMISKNPTVEGQEEEDNQRHINVVKNKLSGWHGIVHTDLEYKIARYVC